LVEQNLRQGQRQHRVKRLLAPLNCGIVSGDAEQTEARVDNSDFQSPLQWLPMSLPHSSAEQEQLESEEQASPLVQIPDSLSSQALLHLAPHPREGYQRDEPCARKSLLVPDNHHLLQLLDLLPISIPLAESS